MIVVIKKHTISILSILSKNQIDEKVTFHESKSGMKILLRVTYFLQKIRVGCILQISKIQSWFSQKSTFLDKKCSFDIV